MDDSLSLIVHHRLRSARRYHERRGVGFFLLGFLSTIKPVVFCLEKTYSPFHLQGIMVKRTHRLFTTEFYKNHNAISPYLNSRL